jgi:hypothetical protein
MIPLSKYCFRIIKLNKTRLSLTNDNCINYLTIEFIFIFYKFVTPISIYCWVSFVAGIELPR